MLCYRRSSADGANFHRDPYLKTEPTCDKFAQFDSITLSFVSAGRGRPYERND